MSEETKAKLRLIGAAKRAEKKARNAAIRAAMTPTAQQMFDYYPYSRRGRTRDLNKAGPYARSIRTYRPSKNDWPGVDDIGKDGNGPTRWHVPRKAAAARRAYEISLGIPVSARKAASQRQLDALAKGRAIRAANLAMRR